MSQMMCAMICDLNLFGLVASEERVVFSLCLSSNYVYVLKSSGLTL